MFSLRILLGQGPDLIRNKHAISRQPCVVCRKTMMVLAQCLSTRNTCVIHSVVRLKRRPSRGGWLMQDNFSSHKVKIGGRIIFGQFQSCHADRTTGTKGGMGIEGNGTGGTRQGSRIVRRVMVGVVMTVIASRGKRGCTTRNQWRIRRACRCCIIVIVVGTGPGKGCALTCTAMQIGSRMGPSGGAMNQ